MVVCKRCQRPLVNGRCESCPPERIVFVPPPLAPTGFVPDPPKPPPPPRDPELELLLARALESQDDEPALLVVSDALMERGDPRGRLISLMLEEEKQRDLMRKVKVNVLVRDHAASWTPPGARIVSYRRGLPDELEWSGATDPKHFVWQAARSIHVTAERVPPASIFHEPRPRLRRLTGLNRGFFSHVTSLAPENLEFLDAFLDTDDLLGDLAGPLSRLPSLRSVTLRTAKFQFDPRSTPNHVRSFVSSVAHSGLERIRLWLPRFSLVDLLDAISDAPHIHVTFLIAWKSKRVASFVVEVDVRRRVFLVPQGSLDDQEGRNLGATFEDELGDKLPVVEV